MLMNTDIYIAIVSSEHHVCPKGYTIAIVSTIAETSANHHLELAPGFRLLGRVEEKFMVGILFSNATIELILSRAHLSHYTSRWRAVSMITSSYPRATMHQVILSLPLMMLRISTVGQKAKI